MSSIDSQQLWQQLVTEAKQLSTQEPLLKEWIDSIIQADFAHAIAAILAARLGTKRLTVNDWVAMLVPLFNSNARVEPVGINVSNRFVAPAINEAIIDDLIVMKTRDLACKNYINALLFSKGYHALCCYRAMHYLWHQGRYTLAHYLQSRMSKTFSIDIHPEAVIGSGIFIDHGSGVVIGATAVVENNVSLMQQVTLGGTGKDNEDRHPKIRDNVTIAPGAQVLGNIEVGVGAFISAASVVLKAVAPNATVAGVPAQVVNNL